MKLATLGLHAYEQKMKKFLTERRQFNNYCDSNPGTKLNFREFCRENRGEQREKQKQD